MHCLMGPRSTIRWQDIEEGRARGDLGQLLSEGLLDSSMLLVIVIVITRMIAMIVIVIITIITLAITTIVAVSIQSATLRAQVDHSGFSRITCVLPLPAHGRGGRLHELSLRTSCGEHYMCCLAGPGHECLCGSSDDRPVQAA